MKYLVLLLTFFCATVVAAQTGDDQESFQSRKRHPIRRIIIFHDTLKSHRYIIREKDVIRYTLKNDTFVYSGKIRNITRDTIFMKHRFQVAGRLNKIVASYVQAPKFPVFRSVIIIPPEKIYMSVATKNGYKRSIYLQIDHTWALKHTDSVHNNFIKLNLTRLLMLDILISYERKLSRKISLETEAGYKIPIHFSKDFYTNWPDFIVEYLAGGISFNIGTKVYGTGKIRPGFYLEPMALFRYSWYKNFWTSAGSETVNNTDEIRQIYGLCFRLGEQQKFRGTILDIYFGLGLKYEKIFDTYYYMTYFDSNRILMYFDPPHKSTTSKWMPIINAGIKIGFGF